LTLLLEHPRPFKAHDAAHVIPRIEDEDESVVERVVLKLARLVGEIDTEM
jgi:hypothetical protein